MIINYNKIDCLDIRIVQNYYDVSEERYYMHAIVVEGILKNSTKFIPEISDVIKIGTASVDKYTNVEDLAANLKNNVFTKLLNIYKIYYSDTINYDVQAITIKEIK